MRQWKIGIWVTGCVLWLVNPVLGQYGQASGHPGCIYGEKIPARVKVLLPSPEAKVWVDDTPTRRKGTERLFVTPPLGPGTYSYIIKATWQEKGEIITQEEKVKFRPGQTVVVDFRGKQRPTGMPSVPADLPLIPPIAPEPSPRVPPLTQTTFDRALSPASAPD